MGRPSKKIAIKEGVSALKSLIKTVGPYKQPRIQLLLLIKSDTVSTKKGLAAALGINQNTAQSWRKRYEKGGLDLLLSDNRGGKETLHHKCHHRCRHLGEIVQRNGFPRSFKELQEWVSINYIPGINYHTVNKHVKRKYGAKLKVARKPHVNKDAGAVEAFKKNR